MFKRTSKFHWKKQLNMLLGCFLIVSSFPAMFAPQKAEAAALFPGGVETDLISWFELTKGWKENGTDDGQYIQKVGDLADSNREWTIYANDISANGQALDVLGTKLINYHLATVPKNNRVMFETNSALETPASGAREVFSVQVAGTGGFPWDLGGGLTSSTRYIKGAISADFGTTTLKTLTPSEDLSHPSIMNIWSGTNDWVLSLNGHQEYQATSNQVSWGTIATRFHYIGGAHNSPFNKGNVAETLVFNRKLNEDERQKVNSYLALKYGVTLQDATGNPVDYIASDGSPMWTAADNTGYGYRVTGIGKDGALDQRQSKSEEDGALVAIALGDQFTKTSEENPVQMGSDKSFFTFSDNGKDATYTVVNDYNTLPSRPDSDQPFTSTVKMMERTFKVDKTDWQDQNITLQVDGADATNHQLYLLVSANETIGAEDKLLPLDGEGKVTLNSSELPDGGVFTFVKFVDKKPLQDKQTEIINENLTQTDYTPESWQALAEQQQAAQAVLDNPDATLAEVQAALEALTSARTGLVKIGALPTPTNLNLNENKLTWDAVEYAESYEVTIKLEDGTTRTVGVPEGTSLDLSTVDPALTPGTYELTVTAKTSNPAYSNSEASRAVNYVVLADKTALQNKVNEANGLTGSTYTEESWSKVEDALLEAERVLNNPQASQAEINQAFDELQQALNTLVPAKGKLDQLNPTGNKGQEIGLNPEFDSSQMKYAATVTNDVYSIGINPVAQYPADTEVRVSLNNVIVPEGDWDELPLQEGKNFVTVGVYDKNGNRLSEYTIEIVREPAVTAGGKLESLVPSVGSLSPAFDPDHTSYAMSVTNSVYQLQLTPTAVDPEATIAIRVNNGEWKEVASGSISDYLALNVGTNTINIKVTDKNGDVKEYGVTVTRDSGNSGNNGGNGNSGGSGGSTTSPTTPSTPSTPANDLDVTLNGSSNPFATGATLTSDGRTTTSVKIEQDKLAAAISEDKGQDLAVHSPKAGDMAVEGLTADTLKQLNDKGASLKVSNLLAIYPVPASNVNLSGIAGQLGNAALNDIAVHIDIKRSSEDLISSAKSKAADAGYELLVDPVDLDLTFSHDGQTVRSGQLDGYAVKYIALPEGIDPNRITTGVIINPDGSVYHVPTVVTEINNRYFARINDLRSSGSYSVIWNPQDFADVQSHWGKEDVNNIAARLDLKGNGDNTFSPDRSITRSEFAEIVVLGLGLMRSDASNAVFPDVSANAWYGNAVAIANEFDIVRGYDNGNFNGGQQITREQGFAMIARAYRLIQSESLPGEEQVASTLAKYEDGTSVAAWAKADVAQLITAGIIQGNGPEVLSPKAQMTRAEVTALMARMLKATNLIDK